MYSASGALSQVILGKRNQRTQVKVSETQKNRHILLMRKVITAGTEVSNAVYSYQMAVAKENTRKQQIETLGEGS